MRRGILTDDLIEEMIDSFRYGLTFLGSVSMVAKGQEANGDQRQGDGPVGDQCLKGFVLRAFTKQYSNTKNLQPARVRSRQRCLAWGAQHQQRRIRSIITAPHP